MTKIEHEYINKVDTIAFIVKIKGKEYGCFAYKRKKDFK